MTDFVRVLCRSETQVYISFRMFLSHFHMFAIITAVQAQCMSLIQVSVFAAAFASLWTLGFPTLASFLFLLFVTFAVCACVSVHRAAYITYRLHAH